MTKILKDEKIWIHEKLLNKWRIGRASGGEAGWLWFGTLTTNLHCPSTLLAIYLICWAWMMFVFVFCDWMFSNFLVFSSKIKFDCDNLLKKPFCFKKSQFSWFNAQIKKFRLFTTWLILPTDLHSNTTWCPAWYNPKEN